MERTISEIGEEQLIRLLVDPADAPSDVVVDNGDDAAVWTSFPGATVATTDAQVEGSHFLKTTPARSIGRKLAAVNLSDLAAMGARPRFALLSVCVSGSESADRLAEIGRGLRERLGEFGVYLIGGNVSRIDGPLVLDLTLLGAVDPLKTLRRSASIPGDGIFVTGSLGGARGGLEVQRRGALKAWPELERRLIDPTPRVEIGQRLSESGLVRAACDISDGLGRDLVRLLGPHGLGAELSELPVEPELERLLGDAALPLALSGGEDYELLFTAPNEHQAELMQIVRATGVSLTRLGTVTSNPSFEFRGAPIPAGYVHFAE